MNKKIIILVVIVFVCLGLYFVTRLKKNNPSSLEPYKEPTPTFFSADHISANDMVVKITDQGFKPVEITIKKGQSVTWVNNLNQDAWPASDPHPTHTIYPEFDVRLPLKVGQAWAFTFNRVGNWGYHNHLSPGMRGIVHVTE